MMVTMLTGGINLSIIATANMTGIVTAMILTTTVDPAAPSPGALGFVVLAIAAGLATALMVMGPGKGIALVDRLSTVECLIVVRRPDGSLKDYPSRGFVID